MTNTLRRAEFNANFGKLTVFAIENNIKFIHGNDSCYRTPEQQRALYDAGKSNCDGTKILSKHQFHLARDIFIVNDKSEIVWETEPYALLGTYWETLGGKWGGHFQGTGFKDPFHFEL